VAEGETVVRRGGGEGMGGAGVAGAGLRGHLRLCQSAVQHHARTIDVRCASWLGAAIPVAAGATLGAVLHVSVGKLSGQGGHSFGFILCCLRSVLLCTVWHGHILHLAWPDTWQASSRVL